MNYEVLHHFSMSNTTVMTPTKKQSSYKFIQYGSKLETTFVEFIDFIQGFHSITMVFQGSNYCNWHYNSLEYAKHFFLPLKEIIVLDHWTLFFVLQPFYEIRIGTYFVAVSWLKFQSTNQCTTFSYDIPKTLSFRHYFIFIQRGN